MTKAERIYRESFMEAMIHIKEWGYEEKSSFNRLSYGDDESICVRTINAIKKVIATERKTLEISYELGVITPEKKNLISHAIDMVELTANKEMRRLKEEVIEIAEETEPAQESEIAEAEEVEIAETKEAENTTDAEKGNENMKYDMAVIIANPDMPEGMTSDIRLEFYCTFGHNPNKYGNGYSLLIDNENGFGNYIDLRYDTTFNPDQKTKYLEKWARNYWNGKDGAYILKSIKITEAE